MHHRLGNTRQWPRMAKHMKGVERDDAEDA
jgi:hypothetical protein